MRIDAKQMLFGHPVLKIRSVIRYAMSEKLTGTTAEIIRRVSVLLHLPQTVSKNVFDQLLNAGYLELKKEKFRNSTYYRVTETDLGRRLGIASANPSISRAKADELLKELLERVKKINANNCLAYRVESVKVFGSYLSEKEVLGDVDVAVKLVGRDKGAAFQKLREQRILAALQQGRRFSNFL